MFKRNAGYVLLVLLVITGLASQITTPTLSSKERRFLVTHLKSSRASLLSQIENLDKAQLNFKPSPSAPSIREHLQSLVVAEKQLWNQAYANIQQKSPARFDRAPLSDEEVLERASKRAGRETPPRQKGLTNEKALTTDEALMVFDDTRAAVIKFAKTSTGNVRSQSSISTIGIVDGYGLLLLLSANTDRYTQEIAAIKAHPRFPQ